MQSTYTYVQLELDQLDHLLDELVVSDRELEMAAGNGRLGNGRSTAGDGTSNPGVNCTCCCN